EWRKTSALEAKPRIWRGHHRGNRVRAAGLDPRQRAQQRVDRQLAQRLRGGRVQSRPRRHGDASIRSAAGTARRAEPLAHGGPRARRRCTDEEEQAAGEVRIDAGSAHGRRLLARGDRPAVRGDVECRAREPGRFRLRVQAIALPNCLAPITTATTDSTARMMTPWATLTSVRWSLKTARAASTAYRSGLMWATFCSHCGAMLIGSSTPDNKRIGRAAVKTIGAYVSSLLTASATA